MSSWQDIKNAVRKFLFSTANREFLTFLLFLAFATIFWFMLTLNETYEQEVDIPLQIENVPNNVVLTSDETDTVRVKVSDKGLVLVNYLYANAIAPIGIDFRTYMQNNETGVVPASDMQHLVAERLAASSKIVSITPTLTEFFYNYGMSKKVPVKWNGSVRPEQPYFLAETIVSPDSVDIFASRNMLDSLSMMYTVDMSHVDFHDTLSIKCPLQKIKGVKSVPDSVRVTFITDILTEEKFSDIAIKGINMPAGKILRTFPSKVEVSFVTGMNRLKSLSKKDFHVVVDYNDIVMSPSSKCAIRLMSVPDGVSKVRLNISEADYLVESLRIAQ